jgi:dTDP-4-dehydrorhamnose 3,5-epimerase
LKIEKTDFKDLLIIHHDVYLDDRGSFREVFRNDVLEETLNYKINFCQDNNVKSSYMVLRGLHYQQDPYAQSKLVYVTEGKILDIAVDMRINSKTYGKYFSYALSSDLNKSLFIPKGFAHGYLSLSENSIVNYKVDSYYNKHYELGISYDDPYLNIDWGVIKEEIIISDKDRNFSKFNWKQNINK